MLWKLGGYTAISTTHFVLVILMSALASASVLAFRLFGVYRRFRLRLRLGFVWLILQDIIPGYVIGRGYDIYEVQGIPRASIAM